VYRSKQVVIGPANHAYALGAFLGAFIEGHCTAMVWGGNQPDAAGWFTEKGDIRGVVLGTAQ
jgi:hypothetical protein